MSDIPRPLQEEGAMHTHQLLGPDANNKSTRNSSLLGRRRSSMSDVEEEAQTSNTNSKRGSHVAELRPASALTPQNSVSTTAYHSANRLGDTSSNNNYGSVRGAEEEHLLAPQHNQTNRKISFNVSINEHDGNEGLHRNDDVGHSREGDHNGRPRRHSAKGFAPSVLATAAEEAAVEHDLIREAPGGEQTEIEVYVYTRRWIILAILVAMLFINQAQYTAFVTIVDETRQFYNISAMQVNILAIIYTTVNCVMIVFVCYFYDKVGFRNGVLLVGVTNCLCAVCKFISVFSPHYAWLVIGQIFGGCSQVLAISIPPLLASIWFPLEERSLATAIGSVGGNIGVAFSFWASPMILNNAPDKEHFLRLMSIYFGAAVFVLLLTVVLVHDQPPKPPSVTARTHETFGSSSFWEMLQLFKKQLLNWSLVRLCFGFGICVGLGAALSNVMPQIYQPYGVDNQSMGIIGAVSIVASCLTTPFVAIVLDKLRAYKAMLMIIYLASGAVLGTLALIMRLDVSHFLPALYILVIGYQVSSSPSVPLMMEFSVEKTYPDPEFISSSFCLLTFSLFASLGGLGFSALLGDNPSKEAGIWCIGANAALAFVSIAVTATVSQERLRYEEEQRIYKSARVSRVAGGDMNPKDGKKKSYML